jgi:hypothetical protein
MCEIDNENRVKKSVYILAVISPNTWWARSGNHRRSAIFARKTRAFRSGSSRVRPGSKTRMSPCNNPHTSTRQKNRNCEEDRIKNGGSLSFEGLLHLEAELSPKNAVWWRFEPGNCARPDGKWEPISGCADGTRKKKPKTVDPGGDRTRTRSARQPKPGDG